MRNGEGAPSAPSARRGRKAVFDADAVAREIADLRDAGFSWKTIAESYGMSRTTLWRYLTALSDASPEL